MRSPLGFKILLVLILGLVAIHPIRTYHYEESVAKEEPDPVPAQPYDASAIEAAEMVANDPPQQTPPQEQQPPPVQQQEQPSEQQPLPQQQHEKRDQQSSSEQQPLQQQPLEQQPLEQQQQPQFEKREQQEAPEQEPLQQEPIQQPTLQQQLLQQQNIQQLQLQQQHVQQVQQQQAQQQSRQLQLQQPLTQQPQPQQLQQQPQQQSVQQQSVQQQSRQEQESKPEQAPQPSVQTGRALVLPGNSSLVAPGSTARTFESWTGCVGASSSKYGTCKNDVECNKSKGRADGSCMGGFGVCCVMALTCGDKSIENNTFFANPDFPEPSWEARLCEVEVKKKSSKILQVMIEFEEFELAPPNHEGECTTDVFQVKLGSARPSPYSLLRICGQNTGQHLYLDVSQIEEPLVLSVATSGGGFPRRWSIRIVQMDEKNFLLAPPGCLQYYTDTVGHFRSFNLGKNLRNLYYAICFRIDNGYSGIRFTENFFGMNGPFCRRRIVAGGHNRTGYEAHPHHLVIPPPGHGPPMPRPHMNHPGYGRPPQQQPFQPHLMHQPRFRRMAYSEPDSAERVTRTFHPIEKEEKKIEKFEDKEYKHQPYQQQAYGSGYQQPVYGPQQGYGPPTSYGPPSPSYGYHHEYNYHPEYKMQDKFDKKWDGPDHESKGWGWMWGNKENKHAIKDEKKLGHGYPPSYGYGDSYGPHQGYGSPGYSSPGYGEYHHKEIDKFGKKYEILEHKHEKNHKDKEKDAGWWKVWGKKEDKKDEKKEKFDQHHEAMFPMIHIPEMPHCEPRFCGQNDVITFPPSGDSISEMCGNRFNRGHGPKIISGSPLVVYVSNRGHNRGAGFDMNYEQVFYIPKPY